jgi:glycosyltransferase involved in cell wall biosynthesis
LFTFFAVCVTESLILMLHHIVVNGRFLSRRVTGVERYGREILSLIGEGYRLEKTRANGWRGHIWEQFILPHKMTAGSVLWSPANTGPLMIRNQALTIHDLSPLEHPEWFRQSFAAWYRVFLPILARRVPVVFTPSEYVKSKVRARFGISNVIVTPNGVDRRRFHPSARQNKYDLPQKYILFIATLEQRKNLNGLLKAWNTVKNDFRDVWLILAGTSGNIFKPFKPANELERVLMLGYAEDEHLPGLYAGATLFVLPSFDEGFGLPALEAMACGVPVVVSNRGALCEVVSGGGLIFDLARQDSLSNAICDVLTNEVLRTSLKEKGLERAKAFSWQTTADLIWKTLNEI